jgi:hypothetical protein
MDKRIMRRERERESIKNGQDVMKIELSQMNVISQLIHLKKHYFIEHGRAN